MTVENRYCYLEYDIGQEVWRYYPNHPASRSPEFLIPVERPQSLHRVFEHFNTFGWEVVQMRGPLPVPAGPTRVPVPAGPTTSWDLVLRKDEQEAKAAE